MHTSNSTNRTTNHYALSQVFSASLIKRLNDSLHENNIRSLLYDCGLYDKQDEWHLIKGLNAAYAYLKENYRCEYVYKNEIVNQLLLKYHSDNSATLLREVASDRSIADIVIINGETVAYEIKTELDRFDRLSGQLSAYQQLYDRLYIVTHPAAVDTVLQRVDESVGIIILDEYNRLETIRKAGPTDHLFDPSIAVNTLRQSELVDAYEKYEAALPRMGTALILGYCQAWYLSLDQESARIIFAQSLKSRRPAAHHFKLIADCDPSIRMLFFGKDLSVKFCQSVREKLAIVHN